MYDQQLAKELGKGRGLGLAPMIMRQLERSAPQAAPAPSNAPLPVMTPSAPIPLPGAPGLLPLAPTRAGVSMQSVAPSFDATAMTASVACPADDKLDCSSPEAFVKSIWPLVVPCHRVVSADNKMTGFSAPGGVRTKTRLLALEGAELLSE